MTGRSSAWRPSLLAIVVTLVACSEATPPPDVEETPSALAASAGDGQSAAAGSALAAALQVTVTGSSGSGLGGVDVAWSVTEGAGTVSDESSETNAAGVASTTWTLGVVAGSPQSVRATVAGLTVDFTAVAEAGAIDSLRVSSGDAQTGQVGEALADSIVVAVVDAFGNPIMGRFVAWSSLGGGAVSPDSSATNTMGLAAAEWSLGGAVDSTHQALASVDGLEVAFDATAQPSAAANLDVVDGDAQTGVVSQALADSVAVRVSDAFGNPVEGVTVAWTVTDGSGSVSPNTSTSDIDGLALAEWTVGDTAGTGHQLQASFDSITAMFTATAEPGPAALLEVTAGDAQSGEVGLPLSDSVGVRVTDAFGNPVGGVVVRWSVDAGGGSVSPDSATSETDGMAYAEWTLGTTAGPGQTLDASIDPAAVSFSATAEAGPAVAIEVVSGDDQLGPTGGPLEDSVVVRLRDQYSNVVPGASTSWTVLAGNGSVSSSTTTTDSDGVTSAEWTLGPIAGFDHVLAAAIPGLAQVSFEAEAAPFDAWQGLPDMPLAVRAAAVATDGTRIFVFGGTTGLGARTDSLQIFDPSDHTWSAGASLPYEVDWASAVGVDGEIHLVGGVTNSVAATNEYWIYDPSLDQWRQGPNVGAPLAGAAIAATDTDLYVMGGIDGPSNRSSNAHIFDLGTEQWDTLPSLPSERINWAGSTLAGDVLAAGGELNGSAVTDHLISLTPGASMWLRLLPDMSTAREAHGAAVLDTRFCVVGGRSGSTIFASTECFRSGQGWTTGPSLPNARAEIGAVSVGGFIYAVAGRNSSGDPVGTITRLRFQ
ncbi:MAG: kelch repeat-containing protein [Gemmatimonadota bacterium]